MVSSSHEAMHRIFQDHPTLFSRVSETLGIPFPPPTAIRELPNDVTETKPVDRRIDTLLRIDTESHGPFLLAVEAQRKKDPEKSASWGYYLEDVPLAALSTIVHGAGPDIDGILKTMSTALQEAPEDVRNPVIEFIFQGLDKLPAAEIWRKLVVVDLSFYKSPLFQETRAEGKAEGVTERGAEDVLSVLDKRGVDVPQEARTRITDCDDPDILRGWLRQAAIATSIDDVFRAE